MTKRRAPNQQELIEQSGFRRAMDLFRREFVTQRAEIGDLYIELLSAETETQRAEIESKLADRIATLNQERRKGTV